METNEKRIGIKEGIAWNSAGNFIYLFFQWLLSYVVIRLLGYETAGIFSLAIAITNSFFGIASYTMRSYQVSDVNGEYSKNTYVESRIITCLGFFIVCVGYTVISRYDSYTAMCIVVYALFKVSEAMSDVFQGVLQLRFRLDIVGISFSIKGVFEFLAFLAAILVLGDLLSALIALTVVSFAIVAFYDFRKAYEGKYEDSASFKTVKALLVACLPMALYGLLFNAAGQVPRIFIEWGMGAEALGYYTSIAMPVVIIQVSASFIFSPLVTPLAQYVKDGDRQLFLGMVKKAVFFVAVIAVVSFAAFYLAGEWLLMLLFGDSIAPYTYLLLPLVGCAVLTALSWFIASLVTVLRQLRTLVFMSFISLLIVLLGSAPFIQLFGMNGASFILIIALAVFVAGCLVPLFRFIRDFADN